MMFSSSVQKVNSMKKKKKKKSSERALLPSKSWSYWKSSGLWDIYQFISVLKLFLHFEEFRKLLLWNPPGMFLKTSPKFAQIIIRQGKPNVLQTKLFWSLPSGQEIIKLFFWKSSSSLYIQWSGQIYKCYCGTSGGCWGVGGPPV